MLMVTMDLTKFASLACLLAYAAAKDVIVCPCQFSYYNNTGPLSGCIAQVPLAAAAAGRDEPVDPNQEFKFENVRRACEYYNSTVLVYQTQQQLGESGYEEWPRDTLFFKGEADKSTDVYQCSYIPKGVNQAVDKECSVLLEEEYFETILCIATPWVVDEKERPRCRCPCGFYYDDTEDANICTTALWSCLPIADMDGIFSLVYSMEPLVALPGRLEKGKDPPRLWPYHSAFFIGDPNERQCGFKRKSDVVRDNCSIIFNTYNLYAAVAITSETFDTTQCPPLEKMGPNCGKADAIRALVAPTVVFMLISMLRNAHFL